MYEALAYQDKLRIMHHLSKCKRNTVEHVSGDHICLAPLGPTSERKREMVYTPKVDTAVEMSSTMLIK